jgi:putative ABC transport system permease protein
MPPPAGQSDLSRLVKFSRNAILSCQILAAHKLRTLLSMTGVVVGVGAVILMVSVGRGAEKRILDRIRGLGTDLVVVNAAPARLMIGRQRTVATVTSLRPEDARAIGLECPHVVAVAPAVNKSLVVRWEGNNRSTTVTGMAAEGFRLRNIPLGSGRAFDEEDDRVRRRVAVLGPTVASSIFGAADPVGQQIRLGPVAFEVIGVTRPRGIDANGADQDDMVLVPLETAMRRLLNIPYLHTIFVQGRHSQSLDRVEQEVRTLLRQRQRLPEGRPDPFTIQNQTSLLETQRETAHAMTLLIGSVAGIALLVGGVGILAVMLISVRERTREIGLRRALGARRQDIRLQFLTEAALLAGTGGLTGVLAGSAATRIAPLFGAWETVFSWPAAAVAFGFSLTVGLVFGLYPALRASRLEPIQALRSG